MREGKKFCPSCKKWKKVDNFALEGKGRLDRSGERRRRKFCTTCVWQRRKDRQDTLKNEEANRRNELVKAMVELSRHDLDRLDIMEEEQFIERTNAQEYMKGIEFDEIKLLARDALLESGYHRPELSDMKPGTYVIVGDSHGKHTKNEVFDLLRTVCKNVDANGLIHLGHFLDDDNDIHEKWEELGDFLTILVKTEEAKAIEHKLEKDSSEFNVVRNEIHIGDFVVTNQEMITDYVRTAVGSLDQEIFPDSTITNLHRLEVDVRCSYKGRKYIMSPGCLCEKHIIKTVKQIDFAEGRQVKVSYPDCFVKYRRMRHTYEFWQQGAIVIHYDGVSTTAIPIQIKEKDGKFYTSYFDKIISSDGEVAEPDEKIFVNGDLHISYHDNDVLSIQENVCKDLKPTKFVTIGDTYNCCSLNHHLMDSGRSMMGNGEVIQDQDIMNEMSALNYILKRMGTWADESYILYGNHERFMLDFVSKYPQLKSVIDFVFLSGLKKLNYNFVDFKEVLEIGPMKFIHGDMRIYGQKGKKIEKMSRTFGDCIMGHIHHPAMRFGCTCVGLSGLLNQFYNEKNASNWSHGFVICNQYNGMNFVSTIPITNHKVIINNKRYESSDSNFSDFELESVNISYNFAN